MTMTGKLIYEETAEDWNERFGGSGWRKIGGNIQSMIFMLSIVRRLTYHSPLGNFLTNLATLRKEGDKIHAFGATIYDLGCAEGDGTAVLSGYLPLSTVKGVDWSESAIERARERWPTCSFQVADVETFDQPATIIFISHVMEHLPDPASVLRNLLQYCNFLVVAVPTIEAGQLTGGHEGATPVREWLESVPAIWQDTFSTVRINPEVAGECVLENSYLYLYEGALTAQLD